MPRGRPKAGFRKTRTAVIRSDINGLYEELSHTESDEQIDTRLRERFQILRLLADNTVNGDSRALIVSGPAGLGKSFTVEQALKNKDESEYTIVKGVVRATGLYKILHQYRNPGNVIVFDDSDSIFFDDGALSLLKASCDTTELRRISWRSETTMRDEDDDRLPTSFVFEGSIVLITNYDFDHIVETKQRFHEHMAAMISRAHYVDLTMKTRRDYVIRIKQVIEQGMLSNSLTASQIRMVVQFIETNQDKLRELSLRMAIKIGGLVRTNPTNWERIAKITCCR